MHHYQQFHTWFGLVAGGMEYLAVFELEELGAHDIRQQQRGVLFKADMGTMYRIVYHTRLMTRVLGTISTFSCHDTDYLYKKALTMDWREFIGPDQSFMILHHAANSNIQHSQFAALRLKDAIVDQLRERYPERPSIDRDNPDVTLHLAIHNNRATISIDCAGFSLNKRGYRTQNVQAPMRETLAAALVRLSGWDGKHTFYDPFCGGGTILAEALMHYCRIPASYLNDRFGFMQLPDYDPALWEKVKAEVNIRELPEGLISGSDVDPRAIEACRQNFSRLPFGDRIGLKQIDFRDMKSLPGVTIVTNPPYGVRLKKADTEQLYKDFGQYIRKSCPGGNIHVFSSDQELLKCMNLRPRWKKQINNGGLEGWFYRMLVFDRTERL